MMIRVRMEATYESSHMKTTMRTQEKLKLALFFLEFAQKICIFKDTYIN